jgi:hypothetical protein
MTVVIQGHCKDKVIMINRLDAASLLAIMTGGQQDEPVDSRVESGKP